MTALLHVPAQQEPLLCSYHTEGRPCTECVLFISGTCGVCYLAVIPNVVACCVCHAVVQQVAAASERKVQYLQACLAEAQAQQANTQAERVEALVQLAQLLPQTPMPEAQAHQADTQEELEEAHTPGTAAVQRHTLWLGQVRRPVMCALGTLGAKRAEWARRLRPCSCFHA